MTDWNTLTNFTCNLGLAEDNGLLLSDPYGAKCWPSEERRCFTYDWFFGWNSPKSKHNRSSGYLGSCLPPFFSFAYSVLEKMEIALWVYKILNHCHLFFFKAVELNWFCSVVSLITQILLGRVQVQVIVLSSF